MRELVPPAACGVSSQVKRVAREPLGLVEVLAGGAWLQVSVLHQGQ